MSTWPDGTPRSHGNAFDWRNSGGSILTSKERKKSDASRRAAKPGKPITIYTRARPKK